MPGYESPAAAFSNTLESLMLQREKSAMDAAKLQMEREKHAADIEDSREDRALRRELLQQSQQDRRDKIAADKRTEDERILTSQTNRYEKTTSGMDPMDYMTTDLQKQAIATGNEADLVNPKQGLRNFAQTLQPGPVKTAVDAQATTPPMRDMVQAGTAIQFRGTPAARATATTTAEQKAFIADQPPDEQRHLEAVRLKLQGTGGSGYGGGGATEHPELYSNLAHDIQSVLEGRASTAQIGRNVSRSIAGAGYMAALRAGVSKADPDFNFNLSDAGTRAVSSNFYQRSMVAVNSVLPNLDTFKALSDQIPRLGIKGVDELLQRGQVQFGDQKVTSLRQMQKLIGDEVGLALGAGTVSDMKLQLGIDVTDTSVSAENFAANIDNIKHFLENRKRGLEALQYASPTVAGQPGSTGRAPETGGAGGGPGTGRGGLPPGASTEKPAVKVFVGGPNAGKTGYLWPNGQYSLTPPTRPNEAAAPGGAVAVPPPGRPAADIALPKDVPPPVAPPPPVAAAPEPPLPRQRLATTDEMMPAPGVAIVQPPPRMSSAPVAIPPPDEPEVPPVLAGAGQPRMPVLPGGIRLAPSRMQLSPQGAQILKVREGNFQAEPYQDSGTGLAIGYGMHSWKGKPVTKDLRITERDADLELERQVKMTYAPLLDKALKVPVTQEQYDALMTVTWNSPTVMRRLVAKLNKGQPLTEADFQQTATINGQPNRGLAARRSQEFAPFR